ncbi:MAG: hypothetical protein DHS20C19_21190 [Acidimicrobiales bacterium]|nr:MAG: hypothetical protein DHS20C19_21190 [Acidimicrobiales bacterium]
MASEQLEATIAMMREINVISGEIDADRAAIPIGTPMPDGIAHEMVRVGECTGAWITDGVRPDAALLYLHGGGYVLGGLGTHGALGARLSADTGLAVLVLDYRLGPEHKHPAALEDALAAMTWLSEQGIPAGRVVIAGDSAGGGLTLATLAALRDRGQRAAAGVALSPWADLTCTNATYESVGDDDPLVGRHNLLQYAAAYAGDTPLEDPRLSPGLGDLADLPPVLVQVGGVEVLLDDSLHVTAGIEAAGGEVTLQRWDEGIHVFQMFDTPESADAIGGIVDFVAEQLGS